MKLHKLNKRELKYECVTAPVYGYFSFIVLFFVLVIVYLIKNPNYTHSHTKEVVYVEVEKYDHIKHSRFFDKMKVKNKKAFIYEVRAVAERTGIPYQDILSVFSFESYINPKAKNPNGGAYGLFQLMPRTAEGLGITQQQLYASNEYEQLKWFEKYLNYYGVENIKSFGDLYTLVYLPSYLGKDDKPIPQYIRDANPVYKDCKNIKQFKLLVEKKRNNLK